MRICDICDSIYDDDVTECKKIECKENQLISIYVDNHKQLMNIMIKKVILSEHCINCDAEITGTVGQLINKVPLCDNCRKNRKKKNRKLFNISV